MQSSYWLLLLNKSVIKVTSCRPFNQCSISRRWGLHWNFSLCHHRKSWRALNPLSLPPSGYRVKADSVKLTSHVHKILLQIQLENQVVHAVGVPWVVLMNTELMWLRTEYIGGPLFFWQLIFGLHTTVGVTVNILCPFILTNCFPFSECLSAYSWEVGTVGRQ